jgi:hypothetical protein
MQFEGRVIYAEQTPFLPLRRSITEIDRDEIVRQTLAEVENRMNAIPVNNTYNQAFKVVVKILRGMKP